MSQPSLSVLNNEPQAAIQTLSIGRILLDLGKISVEDGERILMLQKEKGLRFGDAAVELGLITQEDIQQVLSRQFNYRYLQPGQGNFSSQLVAAYQPFSPQVETLRAIRSQLMLRWFAEGRSVLSVVGVNPGEGCSYLAANLAVVFSQLGEHTLLIDANLRDPCQHRLFNLSETRGLSDILAGRAGMEAISRIEAFLDLSVLGAGTIPPNPQELLGRSAFADFMNQAMGRYDVIIVDTPPAIQSSDALTTSVRCGGALLVSRLNHTRVSDLNRVRDQIAHSGADIVGAVINDF